MLVKSSPDEIQGYLTDPSNMKGNCEAVFFPESEGEIVEAVKKAAAEGKSLTISGNGTGLTGARVPFDGYVLATDKLNRIIQFNKEEKYITVQPGVLLAELQRTVEAEGLMYPPDPTERNCFIGGTVATNASGAKSFKYGPTRTYVEAIRVVLANGEILALERGKHKIEEFQSSLETLSGTRFSFMLPKYSMPGTKHACGYFSRLGMDAIDLFIGSEGTLGIISEVRLKLVDLPENILSAVIFFEAEADALHFLTETRDLSRRKDAEERKSEIDAMGLEFFDQKTLEFLSREYEQIPPEAQAAVWFEQELPAENEESIMEEWIGLISKHKGDEERSWFATDETDRQRFKDFRHAISWKVNEYMARMNITKVGTDVAVPDDLFVKFYYEIKEMVRSAGLDHVVYGHFGDSHVHLNMLPRNAEEHKTAKSLYRAICLRAIEFKGTVSAEHGIGKLKREYLLMMFGSDNILQMIELKKAFDPVCMLSPGNMFLVPPLKK